MGRRGRPCRRHRARPTTSSLIQQWAEERGAKPSAVKGTGGGDNPGIIRLDFPGYSGEGKLEEISWDEWFEKFDENELALLYQEETATGERSFTASAWSVNSSA